MPETKEMEIPEVKGYESSTDLIKQAGKITVITKEDLEKASILREGIAGIRTEIDSTFDPLISEAHKHHKSMIAAKKKIDDPLAEKDSRVKGLMETYHDEVERKRVEAIADAEAERQRKERERHAEEERLAKEALEEEAAGNHEAAENLIQQAATVETQPVEPTAVIPERTKVAGSSSRRIWWAEVTDLMTLVKAVAAGKVPLASIKANETLLNSRAVAEKNDLNIPGVQAKSKSSVASI